MKTNENQLKKEKELKGFVFDSLHLKESTIYQAMFGGTQKPGRVLVFGLDLNLVHSEYRQLMF